MAAVTPYEGRSLGVMLAKSDLTEDVMRSMIVAVGLAALAVGVLAQPAAAKKSKMGCEMGREVWNASEGKCVSGKHATKTARRKTKRQAAE
jgi:hypothetical protein